jgi:hypothetical protein
MNNIAVIYQSKYGATERYARWIAEELGAQALERRAVDTARLETYDAVVYGGGLYASGIAGVDMVNRFPCKNLTLFSVGISDPATTNYAETTQRLPVALRGTPIFHLRGGIDYKRLSLPHRAVMGGLNRILTRQPADKRPAGASDILDTYGKTVDFSDRGSIAPLVAHVRAVLGLETFEKENSEHEPSNRE